MIGRRRRGEGTYLKVPIRADRTNTLTLRTLLINEDDLVHLSLNFSLRKPEPRRLTRSGSSCRRRSDGRGRDDLDRSGGDEVSRRGRGEGRLNVVVRVVVVLGRSDGGGRDDLDGLSGSSKDPSIGVAARRGGVGSRRVEVRVPLVQGVGRCGAGADFDGTAGGGEARAAGASRGGDDLDGTIGGDKGRDGGRGVESAGRAADDLTLGDFCARSSRREVVTLSSMVVRTMSKGGFSGTYVVADDTAGDELVVGS